MRGERTRREGENFGAGIPSFLKTVRSEETLEGFTFTYSSSSENTRGLPGEKNTDREREKERETDCVRECFCA